MGGQNKLQISFESVRGDRRTIFRELDQRFPGHEIDFMAKTLSVPMKNGSSSDTALVLFEVAKIGLGGASLMN